MSATYQTVTLDTERHDIRQHPVMQNEDALDLVLQISDEKNPLHSGYNAATDSQKHGWNLNKLLRFIRTQKADQAGDSTFAVPDDALSVADGNPDQTVANLRELFVNLLAQTGVHRPEGSLQASTAMEVTQGDALVIGRRMDVSASAPADGIQLNVEMTSTNGSGARASISTETVDGVRTSVVVITVGGNGYLIGDVLSGGGVTLTALTVHDLGLGSGSTRGDWAQQLTVDTQGFANVPDIGKTNEESQMRVNATNSVYAYDIVDAMAMAISFAWTKGGAQITSGAGGNTERSAAFDRAKAFRQQIPSNQIKYDMNRFAAFSDATRSKLLAALENQKVAAGASDNLPDFSADDKRYQSTDVSEGAGWLSKLAARVVAHSLRENTDTADVQQRRCIAFGGSGITAAGLAPLPANMQAASLAVDSTVDNGRDPFKYAANTDASGDGTAKYYDVAIDSSAALTAQPVTLTPGVQTAYMADVYSDKEVRYAAALHEGDNVCFSFNVKVTNSQAASGTRSAKVGLLVKQSGLGSLSVDGATGTSTLQPDFL